VVIRLGSAKDRICNQGACHISHEPILDVKVDDISMGPHFCPALWRNDGDGLLGSMSRYRLREVVTILLRGVLLSIDLISPMEPWNLL